MTTARDHVRSDRSRTRPRSTRGPAEPAPDHAEQGAQLAPGCRGGGRARLGRPEARLGQRRGERARVGSELVADELVQLLAASRSR